MALLASDVAGLKATQSLSSTVSVKPVAAIVAARAAASSLAMRTFVLLRGTVCIRAMDVPAVSAN
jgi:hypothetical protein